MLLCVPQRSNVFKGADCEGQVNCAEFIACILIDSIEVVGSDNIVQVVMYNEKVCRVAGALVEARYEHIGDTILRHPNRLGETNI